jgi:DNA-binding NtrC family response regulator
MDGGFFLEEAVEFLERTLITRALSRTGGNRSAASKLLGIHRNTLQKKLIEFKLERKPPQKAKPLVRKVASGS